MSDSSSLAASITKSASKQTYYTVRFMVDRTLVDNAYRAYAYFRWVDDCLDTQSLPKSERHAFLLRQKSLLEGCYRGKKIQGTGPEEQILVDLVQTDRDRRNGLHSYLSNMMAVMAFDADRRGRLISQNELKQYTHWLACAGDRMHALFHRASLSFAA